MENVKLYVLTILTSALDSEWSGSIIGHFTLGKDYPVHTE
jgi:hypothetical protein